MLYVNETYQETALRELTEKINKVNMLEINGYKCVDITDEASNWFAWFVNRTFGNGITALDKDGKNLRIVMNTPDDIHRLYQEGKVRYLAFGKPKPLS